MTVSLSIKGYTDSKNQFDEKRQDWLDKRFKLGPLQRLGAIYAELEQEALSTKPLRIRSQKVDNAIHRIQWKTQLVSDT